MSLLPDLRAHQDLSQGRGQRQEQYVREQGEAGRGLLKGRPLHCLLLYMLFAWGFNCNGICLHVLSGSMPVLSCRASMVGGRDLAADPSYLEDWALRGLAVDTCSSSEPDQQVRGTGYQQASHHSSPAGTTS